jgi:hypothetical protein
MHVQREQSVAADHIDRRWSHGPFSRGDSGQYSMHEAATHAADMSTGAHHRKLHFEVEAIPAKPEHTLVRSLIVLCISSSHPCCV